MSCLSFSRGRDLVRVCSDIAEEHQMRVYYLIFVTRAQYNMKYNTSQIEK
jgi:hypothetical protein